MCVLLTKSRGLYEGLEEVPGTTIVYNEPRQTVCDAENARDSNLVNR